MEDEECNINHLLLTIEYIIITNNRSNSKTFYIHHVTLAMQILVTTHQKVMNGVIPEHNNAIYAY